MRTIRFFFYIAICLASGCAKPPTVAMDAAEYMVSRAYEMGAAQHAPTEFKAARTALADAQSAMLNSDYADAEDSLDFALTHARRAVTLSNEAVARQAEAEAQRQREEELRQAELKAKAEIEARKTAQKPTSQKKPSAPTPAKAQPTTSYEVGEGETLWTISARAAVYHDALLWPLLYQANRDQIKDPRQIFPGQTLTIRRDLTAEDREEARQKARESDIFPVPSEAKDPQLKPQ